MLTARACPIRSGTVAPTTRISRHTPAYVAKTHFDPLEPDGDGVVGHERAEGDEAADAECQHQTRSGSPLDGTVGPRIARRRA